MKISTRLRVVFLCAALLFASNVTSARADLPNIIPCLISTSSITTCLAFTPGLHGIFFGAVNNSTSAQSVTVTCNDSANGTLTGVVIVSLAPMGASQVITWPAGGRQVQFGAACQASGTPSGAGIELYFGVQ